MSALWTSAIAGGMTTFTQLFTDFVPVVALAVGLAVLAVIVGMFTGRNNG